MSYKKRPNFYDTDEAKDVEESLIAMQKDERYKTVSSYSADSEKHPDHQVTFVDKHMSYLHKHPDVNPQHYMANLKLKTKIR